MSTWRTAGTTDTITSCDVCGREELKGTVRMIADDAELFAGTSCAAQLAGRTVTDIKREIKAADAAERKAAQDIIDAQHAAFSAGLAAFLAANNLEHTFQNMKLYRNSLAA